MLGEGFTGFVEMFALVLSFGMLGLTFAAAIHWLRWIYRATTLYIDELGFTSNTSPVMAAGSYLLPGLNLVLPYLHIKELWEALTTGEAREDLFTVHAWWAGLAVAAACKFAWLFSGDSYIAQLTLDLTAAFAYGVATYGAIVIVRQLTASLAERLEGAFERAYWQRGGPSRRAPGHIRFLPRSASPEDSVGQALDGQSCCVGLRGRGFGGSKCP